MKINSKRTIILTIVSVLIFSAGVLAYQYNLPLQIEPDPKWDATINSLDVTRQQFFITSSDVELEAELLIPLGGKDMKPAVVFAVGSGSNIYQTYAPDFIEEYLLGVFLPRDVAVLLVNKRGLGQSSGNWMHNDLQGRAEDMYAAVQHLQNHPLINPDQIGLIGHSQGAGWSL